jgi:pimeloyl-ACP methyl ester carboxylesterase
MKTLSLAVLALFALAPALAGAAEEWEVILQQALKSEYSTTRHNGLKQVDGKSARGLKALWKVLAISSPDQVDWFVREGAFEALVAANGPEAEAEIQRVLQGGGNELAKEAIVYSIIWKLRKQFVKDWGGNDDRKIEEAKRLLRKTRGVDYFALVLAPIKAIDPDGKRYEWLKTAFADKSLRVRLAALNGLMAYPHNDTIPLLIENLKKLEKRKAQNFQEWVFTRFALEALSGEYHRDNVEDWQRWWDVVSQRFSIEKRVEEETGEGAERRGGTVLVKREGVQVTLNMKIAGEGYPLLVLPWEGFEPDYFRPYFHGIEEFCKVYYVQMPSVTEFKGLARDTKSNLVKYPTEILAQELAELMKESGLKRYALLGHGPWSSTSAMIVSSLYAEQVSHLILINPRSSAEAYRDAIANVKREGFRRSNRELIKGADYITLDPEHKKVYSPADADEEAGIGRALSSLRYADPTSPEIGLMMFLYRLPGGVEQVADDQWTVRGIFKNKKPPFPVMVAIGEKAVWTPTSDVMRAASFFERPYMAKFPRSAEMPFMDDPSLFTKHLQLFLKDVLQSKSKKP